MTILNLKIKILSRKEVTPNIYLLSLAAPAIAQQALPGQFLHIKCSKDNYPLLLLRRPISIHRIDPQKGEIQILFQVVGEGTKLLAERPVGDDLDIIGPLGNGFKLYPESKKVMLIGGGIGVAALLALGEEAIRQGKEVQVLIGALNKELVLAEEIFSDLGAKVEVATNDGSYRYKGLVTELLEKILEEEALATGLPHQMFACGPRPLLKKVSEIAFQKNIDSQVSMEERMGCGIGACLGCVCKIKGEDQNNNNNNGLPPPPYIYKRVCIDGPIFRGNEVVWDDQ